MTTIGEAINEIKEWLINFPNKPFFIIFKSKDYEVYSHAIHHVNKQHYFEEYLNGNFINWDTRHFSKDVDIIGMRLCI